MTDEETTTVAPPPVVEIPKLDHPTYEAFDLGAYDESRKGETIRLLMNPTRQFRREFRRAAWMYSLLGASDTFLLFLVQILGLETVEQVSDVLDKLAPDVFMWLFLCVVDGVDLDKQTFSEAVLPYVETVWNEWARTRVKGWAARSTSQKSSG